MLRIYRNVYIFISLVLFGQNHDDSDSFNSHLVCFELIPDIPWQILTFFIRFYPVYTYNTKYRWAIWFGLIWFTQTKRQNERFCKFFPTIINEVYIYVHTYISSSTPQQSIKYFFCVCVKNARFTAAEMGCHPCIFLPEN